MSSPIRSNSAYGTAAAVTLEKKGVNSSKNMSFIFDDQTLYDPTPGWGSLGSDGSKRVVETREEKLSFILSLFPRAKL